MSRQLAIRHRILLWLGVACLCVVVAALVWRWWTTKSASNEGPAELPIDALVVIETGDAPSRGNPKAPVTIVEFSDFQCPYCVRARPAVARVREVYGDKVRFAFRHFPLDFHAQAEKAGEAAACAGEQGKFWEMHDLLWTNTAKLQVPDLKAHAATLGMDAAAFSQCLDSGRHSGLVASDLEAGQGYGVSGTPAFFVNGRPLVGAQPFEAFAQVIDDELARQGLASPGAASR